MEVLVVGATGATGRLLVGQLLDRGHTVRAMVRSSHGLPEVIRMHERLSLIEESVLNVSADELARYVKGCDAVVSCLGHRLNWQGIFGHPRTLVTDATRRLCNAIKASPPRGSVKFVLMNTAGNSNRDLHEPTSFAQRCVIGLLRLLVPPHADNEKAADHLRTEIGQTDCSVQWSAVRPDTLVDQDHVTEYAVYPSPIRSAIFNPGSTSRINVAHFMAELLTADAVWNRWQGQMPVIYNQDVPS